MTIALGILCSDGLVIAADSQSTIPGSLKTQVQKILVSTSSSSAGSASGVFVPNGAIAVSGAGETHYLEELQQAIALEFNGNDTSGEIARKIRTGFRRFYRRTVIPLAHVVSPPEIWMLCGYQKDGARALYTTDRLSLISSNFIATVGSGAFVARALMLETFPLFPSVSVGKLLAIYAVMHVRDRVDGIGGKTQLALIRNNEAQYGDSQEIAEIERSFKRYEQLQGSVLQYVVGHWPESESTYITDEARAMRNELSAFNQGGEPNPEPPTDDPSLPPPSPEPPGGTDES